MIYGLIPVGGKGLRLGLPYSKEMLPQKNYDYFNPIMNHLVEKMELAGAEKIYFVHGSEYKKDVCEYFSDENYVHLLQERLGFANVIYDFFNQAQPKADDKILFGLPDTVFDNNPFVEMVNQSGIVCGLFTTDKASKVDRLDITKTQFQVKTNKTDDNLDWFWGVLKFDGNDIAKMYHDKMFDRYSEIGVILNQYPVTHIYGESYLDLGTWQNYNRYLSDSNSFSNVEIEKKYSAEHVNPEEFVAFFADRGGRFQDITSTDHYHSLNNPKVEFVRYREDTDPDGAEPDITIKNFNHSQLNRFELMVPLSREAKSHNVLHLLSLMGAKFTFSVTKHCYIYYFDSYTVVYYEFVVNNKKTKIIEIELNKIDFNLITKLEDEMTAIAGFDPAAVITKSKFQMIKEQLEYDSTYRSQT